MSKEYSYDRTAEAVADRHQLKVLRQTLRMPPSLAEAMGGPSPSEAEKVLRQKFKYTDSQIRKLKRSYDYDRR